ncbi:Reverse_transcriptase (RNA-dependent DNA polymerase) [Hexamita inflata]|uniref:Reverse transcriptase (RNA-dependent DNA polymerase) n=1 Tax=Hexamita inflata TaxID=28002 RepID=A0AA86U6F9_9EUKA|nr:Reverse transcriptase (RNA-dependent DNA polymerase) [Hexamita inflata]
MVAIGYADDILIMVTPGREKDAIRIAIAEYERLKLEVNTNKTSSNDKTLFENNSGIVTYLGQEFGQDAKPLTDQILANVQERIGSLFDLDISLHNQYTLYEKCILTCANYGPLVDVCDTQQNDANIEIFHKLSILFNDLYKFQQLNINKILYFTPRNKCVWKMPIKLPIDSINTQIVGGPPENTSIDLNYNLTYRLYKYNQNFSFDQFHQYTTTSRRSIPVRVCSVQNQGKFVLFEF